MPVTIHTYSSYNRLAALLIALSVTAACGGSSDAPAPAESGAATPAATADAGVQTVTGQAPAAGGNFPAIVVLEPIGADPAPPQAAPPVMDQVQQTFIPSVLLVRTGQPVEFKNNDDVLHNVRVREDATRESTFNVAIPTGETYTHTFIRDGFYDVGCDIHPGMSAQVLASASPYVAVAAPSGAFSIANVPNGPYKAIAYAGAAKVEREISVAAGMAPLDLTKAGAE
jgi:plastocyanin